MELSWDHPNDPPEATVTLPRTVVNRLMFELAGMTLDKRQHKAWINMADALGWDSEGMR